MSRDLIVEVDGKTIVISEQERQPCEVFSRVMGYYRPVKDWNIGKKSEFKDRKGFDKVIKE